MSKPIPSDTTRTPAVYCEHLLEPKLVASIADVADSDLLLTDAEREAVRHIFFNSPYQAQVWLMPMPKADLLRRLIPNDKHKEDISARAQTELQDWLEDAFAKRRSLEEGEEFSITFRVCCDAYDDETNEPLFSLKTEKRDEQNHW